MNRYIDQGIIADALNGARVVVCGFARDIGESVARLTELCRGIDIRVTRANGRQRIEFPNGGSIKFVSTSRTGGRGFTADVVVVDRAIVEADSELLAALCPVARDMVFI